MLFPEGVAIDGLSGEVTPSTGRYTKKLSELGGLFRDTAAFDKAVAAEVQKLGLRPKAAEHKEAPADTDLTPTQRVLAAKGVGSIRELSPKLNA